MSGRDIFNEVIPICDKNFKTIACVFNNPEQINAKFVLNIYHLKLRVSICILNMRSHPLSFHSSRIYFCLSVDAYRNYFIRFERQGQRQISKEFNGFI